LTGNVRQMNEGFRTGSRANAQYRKAQMLDNNTINAEIRAAGSGTGANIDNVTRQQAGRMIKPDSKTLRQLTPRERTMAEAVNQGSRSRNALRFMGRMAPTGTMSNMLHLTNGVTATSAFGTTGALAAGALAGTGLLARGMANRATTRAANRLSEVVRSGGHTAEELAAMARRGAPVSPTLAKSLERQMAVESRALPASVAGERAFLDTSDAPLPKRAGEPLRLNVKPTSRYR